MPKMRGRAARRGGRIAKLTYVCAPLCPFPYNQDARVRFSKEIKIAQQDTQSPVIITRAEPVTTPQSELRGNPLPTMPSADVSVMNLTGAGNPASRGIVLYAIVSYKPVLVPPASEAQLRAVGCCSLQFIPAVSVCAEGRRSRGGQQWVTASISCRTGRPTRVTGYMVRAPAQFTIEREYTAGFGDESTGDDGLRALRDCVVHPGHPFRMVLRMAHVDGGSDTAATTTSTGSIRVYYQAPLQDNTKDSGGEEAETDENKVRPSPELNVECPIVLGDVGRVRYCVHVDAPRSMCVGDRADMKVSVRSLLSLDALDSGGALYCQVEADERFWILGGTTRKLVAPTVTQPNDNNSGGDAKAPPSNSATPSAELKLQLIALRPGQLPLPKITLSRARARRSLKKKGAGSSEESAFKFKAIANEDVRWEPSARPRVDVLPAEIFETDLVM